VPALRRTLRPKTSANMAEQWRIAREWMWTPASAPESAKLTDEPWQIRWHRLTGVTPDVAKATVAMAKTMGNEPPKRLRKILTLGKLSRETCKKVR